MWIGVLVGAVGTALLLAGCGADDTTSAPGPSVVAAFYPVAWVGEQVGAGKVDVEVLTAPGVEPHDLELSPQQVAQVADADVVLLERGFQPAVDSAVEQESDAAVVDAAEVVTLVGADQPDPHFWLDPRRMSQLAVAVADTYARADPDRAGTYRQAAGRLVGDLERLDRDYREALTGCRTDVVVTSHDAFGYLARRYGLTLLPIAGTDPGSEPSTEHLAELTDQVRQHDVTTIFTETLVSPAVAETLAAETGVEVATLDPIEGLTDDTDDTDDYLSLMRANLDALTRANGC